MTVLELTRGDRASVLIGNLVDGLGAPTVFGALDVLHWTAKADLGDADSDAILSKTSVGGGITITVGGDNATVHIVPADWAGVRLNADQPFFWDLELLIGGSATAVVTLASGTGIIKADASGNPTAQTILTGGVTCTPWATSADAVAPCNAGVDTAELDLCMQFASDVLFQFTRRKYRGVCTDEVFPNAQWRSFEVPGWWPSVNGGGFGRSRWGWCSCHRTEEYGCSRVPQIVLPGYPVDPDSVVVTIEGVTFTGWELRDRRKLVRTDGEGWPCCQPLPLNAAADGGWNVRYQYGVNPPSAGKRCAAILGCQLYAAFNPQSGQSCKLPERVTNIARQGVTIGAVLDPLDLFEKGKTGLATVDMWIASDRYGDRQSAAVIVPGRGRAVTRTR